MNVMTSNDLFLKMSRQECVTRFSTLFADPVVRIFKLTIKTMSFTPRSADSAVGKTPLSQRDKIFHNFDFVK